MSTIQVTTNNQQQTVVIGPNGERIVQNTTITISPAAATLISGSQSPPVTITQTLAPTNSAVVDVNSVAPVNLPQNQTWSTLLGMMHDQTGLQMKQQMYIGGTPVLNNSLCLVTADEKGQLVKTPIAEAQKLLNGGNSPAGFVLAGNIKLFGLLPAELTAYYGTAVSTQTAIQEKIVLAEKLSVGALVPSMADDEALNAIKLSDVELSYVSRYNGIQSPGTWLGADLEFSGPLQPVSDVLKNVFGQTKPGVHIEALLSNYRDWNTRPSPPGLNMWGILEDTHIKVGDVEVTSLGVQVMATRGYELYPKFKKTWSFGWGFMGKANIMFPGSVTPLQVMASIQKDTSDMLRFFMLLEDEAWTDVLGVKGLDLVDVQIQASLPLDRPKPETLSLDIAANFKFGKGVFHIEGSHNPSETALTAYLADISLNDILTAAEEMFGIELDDFEHDVYFRNVYLKVSSATGLTLQGGVTINGYTSANATINIGRNGILVNGSVGDVRIGDVTIVNAAINLNIGLAAQGKVSAANFCINGTVTFGSLKVGAGMYIAKKSTPTAAPGAIVPTNGPAPANTDSEFDWVIYGEISDKNLSTGSIIPSLKDTDVDFSLRNVAFMASNMSGSTPVKFNNVQNYPIVKGFQLYAQLDTAVPAIDKLVGSSNGTLTLQAIFANGALDLNLLLPIQKAISFRNPNMISKPIAVSIHVGDAKPCLSITAGMYLKVQGQENQLEFNLGLKVDPIGAKGFAEMKGWWYNPFGLSKKLAIGPVMAVQVGIEYATFITTGLPSQFAVAGGIMFGKTTGEAALSISQNPTEQLISAKVKDLDLSNIIDFASNACDLELTAASSSYLVFKEVSMYMSSGVQIGTNYYPKGVSFAGAIEILGKKAQMSATMTGAGVRITGALDSFEIGPLAVSGYQTANPQFDITMQPNVHKIFVDGQVKLGPILAALNLNMNQAGLGPLNLTFDAKFQFTDLLKMTAVGKCNSSLGSKALKDLEFDITATLENELVDYIVAQINSQFLAAQKASAEAFDKARADVDRAKAALEAAIVQAQKDLDAKAVVWERKRKEVNDAFQAAKDKQTTEVKRLQGEVDNAKKKWDAAIDKAQKNLDQARTTAAQKINEAKGDVDKARRDGEADIASKRRDVDNAQGDMDRRFGQAIKDLQNAKNALDSKQHDVDDINQQIRNKQGQIDRASKFDPKKIGWGLELGKLNVEKGVRYAVFEVAETAVKVAEAIVEGPGYKAASQTLDIAKGALKIAQASADAALSAANGFIDATIKTQSGLVSVAEGAVNIAKTASEEMKVFQIATATLQAYLESSNKIVSAAQVTVNSLTKCAEFAAYETATAALAFARANTKDLDILKNGLDLVENAEEVGLKVASWVVTKTGNLFNLRKVTMTAQLSMLHKTGRMAASIQGVIADQEVNYNIDFTLGDAASFVKNLFKKIWDDIDNDIISIIKPGSNNKSKPALPAPVAQTVQSPAPPASVPLTSAPKPAPVVLTAAANTTVSANSTSSGPITITSLQWGNKEVSDKTAIKNMLDTIISRKIFAVGNSTLGGDPLPGVGKTCVVKYTDNGVPRVRSAPENTTMDFSQDIITITYGNKHVTDQALYDKVLPSLLDRTKPFAVNNSTMGFDPLPGQLKACSVMYVDHSGAIKTRSCLEGTNLNFNQDILSVEYGKKVFSDSVVSTKVLTSFLDVSKTFVADNAFFGNDPLPGQGKTCKITYIDNGVFKTRTYAEGQTVNFNVEVLKIVWGNKDITDATVYNRCLSSLLDKNISLAISNETFGGDPLSGQGKTCNITVRYEDGVMETKTANENSTLQLAVRKAPAAAPAVQAANAAAAGINAAAMAAATSALAAAQKKIADSQNEIATSAQELQMFTEKLTRAQDSVNAAVREGISGVPKVQAAQAQMMVAAAARAAAADKLQAQTVALKVAQANLDAVMKQVAAAATPAA